jgi:hypothetical protein
MVSEQWMIAENKEVEEPRRQGLTRIQQVLLSFLQYSDLQGALPTLDQLDNDEATHRVALANVLCAAMDMIDGVEWEGIGTLKWVWTQSGAETDPPRAMRYKHQDGTTRVNPRWTFSSARTISNALLDVYNHSTLSQAYPHLAEVDYHPLPLPETVYDGDPAHNADIHNAQRKRFKTLTKGTAQSPPGDYDRFNIRVDDWTQDLATAVRKELELWEEGEGRARVGVVVRMLDEMVDRPQAAREGA